MSRRADSPGALYSGCPSVLLSLLLHADFRERTEPTPPRAHRVSLSDQRRSAPSANFSPTPSVSILVFEDSVSVDASSQTHAGPSASTQVKRLQNWVLEQELQFPPTFTAHARVFAQPSLSADQLRSRRSVCYAHNPRDARRSSLAVCERVVLVPPARDADGLGALVAGAWALATPIIVFDDRYATNGFWDFLAETVRCGANYFATATGIVADVQMLAVPLYETQPHDSTFTVDLLWTTGEEVEQTADAERKATIMCARDAAQLDVILERALCADLSLRDRERPAHLVCSVMFFNQRTLRKASLTVVRLVNDAATTAADLGSPEPPKRVNAAAVLETLITDPKRSDVTNDDAVRSLYMSTRLTSALYKKVCHFMRTKEYQNGALFHWICNVPCGVARRLPAQLPDQQLLEFRLCEDGDDRSSAMQAAQVVDTIQRVQRAAQHNATEFVLLDPRRSSLTAERLSLYAQDASQLPNVNN